TCDAIPAAPGPSALLVNVGFHRHRRCELEVDRLHVVAAATRGAVCLSAKRLVVDRQHDKETKPALHSPMQPVFIDSLMTDAVPAGPSVELGMPHNEVANTTRTAIATCDEIAEDVT